MIEYNKDITINESLTCGYKTFCDSEHPLVNDAGWIYYHRHVASLKEGRWLTAEDQVHHKDGSRINNDKDNLMVLSKSDHVKLHNPKEIIKKVKCPGCKKYILRQGR